MPMLEHALRYATAMNWRIFPCGRDKKPLIKEWQHKATTDEEQIKAWWQQWPDAGIALACGPDSGVWVLDVDLPDGPDALVSLQNGNGELPATLEQKTGSGGKQLFFGWNGREVRNTARKLGPGLDTRGFGGYVVLPPSIHPSGNEYAWTRKVQPVLAPSWLMDRLEHQEQTHRPCAGTVSEYGNRALASELAELSSAGQGQRNNALNVAAFRLGQLVAGGELSEIQVEASLIGVAMAIGLNDKEARATIASGMKRGAESPRSRPKDDLWQKDITDTTDITDTAGTTGNNGHQRTPTDTNGQSTDKTDKSTDNQRTQINDVKNAVKEWILLDNRQFSLRDVCFDLGATSRQQKKNISDYLSAFCREGIIERVGGVRGVFTCISKEKESELINIDFSLDEEEEGLDLHFPLNMDGIISLLPGNIAVVAGESNAGKTAVLMDWAFFNLTSSRQFTGLICNSDNMPVRYFSSEMGAQEMRMRARAFGYPAEAWTAMKAIERNDNFHQVIDPDGINFIDFLEIHDEFYKVGAKIRAIHETLRKGICVIALQKKKGADYGRGGEMSLEKPRLYVSLSEAVKGISVATIQKAKNYKTPFNPNGYQLDFKIENKGGKITSLTDWRFMRKAEREELNQRYEQELGFMAGNSEAVKIKCKCGFIANLQPKDIDKWQASFTNLNVRRECEAIGEASFDKAWLERKSWFFQLSGLLKKLNDKG